MHEKQQARHRFLRFIALPIFLSAGIHLREHFLPASGFYAIICLIFLICLIALGFTSKLITQSTVSFTSPQSLIILKYCRVIILYLFILSLGIWRCDQVLPQGNTTFTCSGIWQNQNFSQPNIPFGERLQLRLITGNCPMLRGKTVLTTHYQRKKTAIGTAFSTRLSIKSGKHAHYATLPKEAKITAAYKPPFLTTVRENISRRIDSQFKHQSKWIRALILGDRSHLSHRDQQYLQRTGTTHLLAISGLHLGIIIAIFYTCSHQLWGHSRLRFICEPHTIGIISGLIGGFIFVFISGAHTPVIRAWIMYACLLFAWLNLPFQNGIFAIIAAINPVLLFDPLALYSIGAWLSFFATASIILLYRHLRQHSRLSQWFILQLGLTFLITPIIWATFGGISIVSILVNLMLIPWLTILLLLILCTLLVPLLTPITALAMHNYLSPITLFANLSYAYIEPTWQPSIACAFTWSLAFLFLLAKARKTATIFFCASIINAISPFFNHATFHAPTKKQSIIIYPQPRQAVIFNTGYQLRKKSDAHRYLLPELRHRHAKIIAIIISEDSPYTIGGLNTLLKAYPNTPVYTLKPMPNLGFTHQYCPELEKTNPIQFQRKQHCTVSIGDWKSGNKDTQP